MLRTLTRDDRLAAGIDSARQASLDWLASMQAPGQPKGVMRISAAHDPSRWPGVLLPGTYNGIMALDLLGGVEDWTTGERAALVAWLEERRLPDGLFHMAGTTDFTIYKKPDLAETWRYLRFHLTNYSLGAIEALDPARKPELAFLDAYLLPAGLRAWLGDRDMRDPWQEGNNIVNLASFLLLKRRFGGPARLMEQISDAFDILYDWHDRHREPTTGFWGVGQLSDPVRLLHAFAGAMHNFHIWYHEERALPGHENAVDYVLGLPPAVHSACIDVDAVDLLVHGWRLLDYRRAEIEAWLLALLPEFLADQNTDGGFCDVREGIRRQDGWVKGYEEPQGISNTFATWFRWIAIAMIADVIWPGRWRWNFRRMIGIGYRMPDWPGAH